MKIKPAIKLLISGLFSLVASVMPISSFAVMPVVLAADLQQAIVASKQALSSLTTNNFEQCLEDTRTAKQHYKILVGDFSDTPARDDYMGKMLDEIMKRYKKPKLVCAPENQANEAQALQNFISTMEKYQKHVAMSR